MLLPNDLTVPVSDLVVEDWLKRNRPQPEEARPVELTLPLPSQEQKQPKEDQERRYPL